LVLPLAVKLAVEYLLPRPEVKLVREHFR
jgi:hypothetical protein